MHVGLLRRMAFLQDLQDDGVVELQLHLHPGLPVHVHSVFHSPHYGHHSRAQAAPEEGEEVEIVPVCASALGVYAVVDAVQLVRNSYLLVEETKAELKVF